MILILVRLEQTGNVVTACQRGQRRRGILPTRSAEQSAVAHPTKLRSVRERTARLIPLSLGCRFR